MANFYGTNAADETIQGTNENDRHRRSSSTLTVTQSGETTFSTASAVMTSIYASLTGINFLGGQEGNDTIYGGNNANTIRGR